MRWLFLILLGVLWPQIGHASDVKVSLGFSSGVVYSVSLADGTRAPPRLAHGLSFALPTRSLVLVGDLGFSTGLTVLDPSPTVILGFSRSVGAIGLGMSAAYIYAPPYEGTDTHLIGVSVVPAVPLIEKRLLLIVPLGPTYNATGHTMSAGAAVKLIFTPK